MVTIDVERTLNKIQYAFMIKTLNHPGIEGTYLNQTRALYEKPTDDVTLKGEMMKTFPLPARTR